MAIISFRDNRLALLLEDAHPGKGFPVQLINSTRRKLELMNSAVSLQDLRYPGNRLESLKGDLSGRWSIRVNDQFRLVFEWTEAGPANVEFVDYH